MYNHNEPDLCHGIKERKQPFHDLWYKMALPAEMLLNGLKKSGP